MNTKLIAMSLNSLQARLDAAKAFRDKCANEVSLSKQSFHALPDVTNKGLLHNDLVKFEYAAAETRKAAEAVRVFCFRAKPALTGSGRVIRY